MDVVQVRFPEGRFRFFGFLGRCGGETQEQERRQEAFQAGIARHGFALCGGGEVSWRLSPIIFESPRPRIRIAGRGAVLRKQRDSLPDASYLSLGQTFRYTGEMRENVRFICAAAAVVLCSVIGRSAERVSEAPRDIPVAYEADVVVLGGSSGAVAAACEASAQGRGWSCLPLGHTWATTSAPRSGCGWKKGKSRNPAWPPIASAVVVAPRRWR